MIGTRISETIGIMYSDVDFTSNSIYIRRQLGRNIKNESNGNLITEQMATKTSNGVRCVPAPDWVIDELGMKNKNRQSMDYMHMIVLCFQKYGKTVAIPQKSAKNQVKKGLFPALKNGIVTRNFEKL